MVGRTNERANTHARTSNKRTTKDEQPTRAEEEEKQKRSEAKRSEAEEEERLHAHCTCTGAELTDGLEQTCPMGRFSAFAA